MKHFPRLMWMRQRRSQAKKESKPCQPLSSIKTEKDLKILLVLIKTESEAPLQSTHKFARMKISILNISNRKINLTLLFYLVVFFLIVTLICLCLRQRCCWQLVCSKKVYAWTMDLSIRKHSHYRLALQFYNPLFTVYGFCQVIWPKFRSSKAPRKKNTEDVTENRWHLYW